MGGRGTVTKQPWDGQGRGCVFPYLHCLSPQGLSLEPHPHQPREPQLCLDLPGSGSDCPRPSSACLQIVACLRMNDLETLVSPVPCLPQLSSVLICLGLRRQRGGLCFFCAHQEMIPETLEDREQLLLGSLSPALSPAEASWPPTPLLHL